MTLTTTKKLCTTSAPACTRECHSNMAAPYVICVCSGDGIGPEVCAQAERVLTAVGAKFGHSFTFDRALVGGAAWDATGEHLPASTLASCMSSDAVLFGSVGGPPTPAGQEPHPRWANAERNAILGKFDPMTGLQYGRARGLCWWIKIPLLAHVFSGCHISLSAHNLPRPPRRHAPRTFLGCECEA